MATAEEGEDKDESFMPGLLGSWHLHTGSGSASCYAMRDRTKRKADGRTDVQPRESEKPLSRLPCADT